jgi:hypothetical protein
MTEYKLSAKRRLVFLEQESTLEKNQEHYCMHMLMFTHIHEAQLEEFEDYEQKEIELILKNHNVEDFLNDKSNASNQDELQYQEYLVFEEKFLDHFIECHDDNEKNQSTHCPKVECEDSTA